MRVRAWWARNIGTHMLIADSHEGAREAAAAQAAGGRQTAGSGQRTAGNGRRAASGRRRAAAQPTYLRHQWARQRELDDKGSI